MWIQIIQMTIFIIIGAFLSVMLTRILIQNGRRIEQNGKMIEQNGEKIDKLAELIKVESEGIRELIKSLRSK